MSYLKIYLIFWHLHEKDVFFYHRAFIRKSLSLSIIVFQGYNYDTIVPEVSWGNGERQIRDLKFARLIVLTPSLGSHFEGWGFARAPTTKLHKLSSSNNRNLLYTRVQHAETVRRICSETLSQPLTICWSSITILGLERHHLHLLPCLYVVFPSSVCLCPYFHFAWWHHFLSIRCPLWWPHFNSVPS